MSNYMKETRKALGWTREQLAISLGCSYHTVHRHENEPHRTTLVWQHALNWVLHQHEPPLERQDHL